MEIRVMTFNIHHGVGIDGQFSLERIADIIASAKPDLVGLNEVDRFHRRSDYMDEASYLGALTGMHFIFGPSVVRKRKMAKRPHEESRSMEDSTARHRSRYDPLPDKNQTIPDTMYYGNALLSRHPIVTTVTHSFPFPMGIEGRSAIEAIVNVNGKRIKAFVTHLSLDPITHLRQASLLLQKVLPLQLPTLLMGDWNMLPDGPRYRRITGHLIDAWGGRRKGGETYPATGPTRRLDYVFLSAHFTVEETKVMNENPYASDHLPFLAKLRLS